MKDFDLAKEICKALEEFEKESRNCIYILSPNTVRKVSIIKRILVKKEHKILFDMVTNTINICVLEYVFDSCICDLKRLFETVDSFVIDALDNGQVSIEMKILNAAEIVRRK